MMNQKDRGFEKGLKKIRRAKLMQAIMRDLSERARTVVFLYYFDELTLKEIAIDLDLSESRVSQIHSKVLFRLKRLLRSYDDDTWRDGYSPCKN